MALEHFDTATRTLDDREVVQRVLAGERELFELLMRRYNQRLYRVTLGVLGKHDEVEDVLQDAYVASYQHLDQFKGESFGPWITKIVLNGCYSRLRARRHVRLVDIEEHRDTAFHSIAEASMPEQNPEPSAHRSEMLQCMEDAITRLPRDFRSVFVLRAVEQLSIEETATCLEIAPATVKTRYHRARNLLQRNLSRKIDACAADAFIFGGTRCDRVVRNVFSRLASW